MRKQQQIFFSLKRGGMPGIPVATHAKTGKTFVVEGRIVVTTAGGRSD